MEIKIEIDNDVCTISLPSRAGGRVSAELLQEFQKLVQDGFVKYVVDFSESAFVDSSTIGSLVSMASQVRDLSGSLVLRNLNTDLMDLFTETGLDTVFAIERGGEENRALVDLFETKYDVKLEISREITGAICLMRLNGLMNHPIGTRYFKQQLLLAMTDYQKILLDFENLTYFDSLSVSVILGMSKLLKDTGGSLRICCANYIIQDLFSTLNIDQAIRQYDSVEEALADTWD
jgi:anti-anti-sigma factor